MTRRSFADLADVSHFVYRAYDATGRLLYVGCSVDVERRMEQHGHWWRRLAARVTWVQYPDYASGRAAEAAAIVAEAPVYNARRPGISFDESWRLQDEYAAALDLTA